MELITISGYAYPAIQDWVLESWLPDLTFLGNFSYGITTEGGIIDLADEKLTEAARRAGVLPMMVLTPLDASGTFNDVTASEVLSDPQKRSKLVYHIREILQRKGLAGVDFDFEFIPAENRQDYVELLRQAKEELAPLGYYVTAALDYAVSVIPREKILMGMPNYGYDWTLPFVRGESRAEKLASEEAFWRAQYYNAEILYDQLSQAPFFTYFDSAGRKHVVWYEDQRSIRAKMALAEEYGLAGMGFWNIMDYNPANSAVLNEMYQVRKL